MLVADYGLHASIQTRSCTRFWHSGHKQPLGWRTNGNVAVALASQQVDLDLGNYERFLDITLTKDNNITTGKIY